MITIVVPLDGSKLAEGVLPHVENLASRLRAEVYFVQVVDIFPQTVHSEGSTRSTVVFSMEEELEKVRKSLDGYFSGIVSAWRAKDIDAKWDVVHGTPAVSIINFARSHDASLIAMSTHGRSGLSRLVFGSVADRVMREAGMPVLMVRPTEKTK